MAMELRFERKIEVQFGDCDPAGLVFYPNFFAWFDGTYHAYLKHLGLPHAELCTGLEAVGTGLMDVGARFKSPATDGDMLRIQMTIAEWEERSFKADYNVTAGERPVLEGYEVRGLFQRRDGVLKAAPVAPLRALLEGRAANQD